LASNLLQLNFGFFIMSSKGKRSLRNDLNNNNEKDKKIDDAIFLNKASIETDQRIPDKYNDDIFDKLLRGCYALIPSILTSGVIAGFIEITTDWIIQAGSLPMISLTVLTFYGWYFLLKKFDK